MFVLPIAEALRMCGTAADRPDESHRKKQAIYDPAMRGIAGCADGESRAPWNLAQQAARWPTGPTSGMVLLLNPPGFPCHLLQSGNLPAMPKLQSQITKTVGERRGSDPRCI